MEFGGYCPLPIRLGGSWSAAQHARAASDLATLTRAVPFAWITITTNGASTPTLIGYNSMPGVGALWAPTLIGVATGHARIAWGAAFSDAYERPEPIRLGHVKATPCSASARIATAFPNSDFASIDVIISNASGTLVDDTVTVRVT
jgi:hypothetical protein